MIEYLNMPNHHYDLITCFGNTIAHLDVSLNHLVFLSSFKHKYLFNS